MTDWPATTNNESQVFRFFTGTLQVTAHRPLAKPWRLFRLSRHGDSSRHAPKPGKLYNNKYYKAFHIKKLTISLFTPHGGKRQASYTKCLFPLIVQGKRSMLESVIHLRHTEKIGIKHGSTVTPHDNRTGLPKGQHAFNADRTGIAHFHTVTIG